MGSPPARGPASWGPSSSARWTWSRVACRPARRASSPPPTPPPRNELRCAPPPSSSTSFAPPTLPEAFSPPPLARHEHTLADPLHQPYPTPRIFSPRVGRTLVRLVKTDGILGMYRGLGPPVCMMMLIDAVNFTAFGVASDAIRRRRPRGTGHRSPLDRLAHRRRGCRSRPSVRRHQHPVRAREAPVTAGRRQPRRVGKRGGGRGPASTRGEDTPTPSTPRDGCTRVSVRGYFISVGA